MIVANSKSVVDQSWCIKRGASILSPVEQLHWTVRNNRRTVTTAARRAAWSEEKGEEIGGLDAGRAALVSVRLRATVTTCHGQSSLRLETYRARYG